MNFNDFLVSQLTRDIVAERLRDGEQARRARFVATLRRLQPGKRPAPRDQAPVPRKATV